MHTIVFKNCQNDWKNALPLGNGVLGAMVHYKKKRITFSMNHYEIYYNINESVLPADMLKAAEKSGISPDRSKEFYERAERNRPRENEPFYYYRLDKSKVGSYAVGGFSGSYPTTGEVVLELADSLLERALKAYGGKAKDDMTAVAVRLFKNITIAA